MPFDLDQLDQAKTRWLKVGLGDMEIEFKRVTPKDTDRFRKRLIDEGVGIITRDGRFSVNRGRESDWYASLAATYVTGWRNVSINGTVNPPYDPKIMGDVLSKSRLVFQAVDSAIEEEGYFFSVNGDGSAT